MKRIFPLLLILALIAVQLPYFLAVPVKAAELDYDDFYIELLDFGGVAKYTVPDGRVWENTGAFFSILGGSSTVYFDLPYLMDIGYIDILVNTGDTSRPITTASAYGKSLNIVRQGEFYRIFGKIGMYDKSGAQASQLVITFNSSVDVWCDFLSVKVGSTNNLYFSTTGNGTLAAGSVTTSFSFPTSNSATINSQADTSVLGVLEFDDWAMYDFIDVFFYIIADHIDSFTAWGTDFIPLDYSFVSSSDSSAEGHYLVSCRLDLRSMDRLSSDLPAIYFQIMCNTNEVVQMSVMRCNGLVLTNNANYFAYWFKQVISSSKENNSSILSAISSAADQIASAISSGMGGNGQGAAIKENSQQVAGNLDSAVQEFGSVSKPSPDSVQGEINITGIISPSQISGSTSFLTALFNVPSLLQITTLGLMLALIATALFGKR